MKSIEYLFAYGTLLLENNSPPILLLKSNSQLVGDGFFYGLLYNIDNYPCAIISEDPENKVYGKIFKLHGGNSILDKIDKYEGIGSNFPQPNEFKRNIITAYSKNKQYQCWAYLYNREIENFQLIESGDYLKFLKESKSIILNRFI